MSTTELTRYATHQLANYVAIQTGGRIDVVQRGVSGRLHYSLSDGNLLPCDSTTLEQLLTAAQRAEK